MTKVLVNNSRTQMIFDSYKDLKKAFETTDNKIRQVENKGTPLKDNVTGTEYYVDKLFHLDNYLE